MNVLQAIKEIVERSANIEIGDAVRVVNIKNEAIEELLDKLGVVIDIRDEPKIGRSYLVDMSKCAFTIWIPIHMVTRESRPTAFRMGDRVEITAVEDHISEHEIGKKGVVTGVGSNPYSKCRYCEKGICLRTSSNQVLVVMVGNDMYNSCDCAFKKI